MVRSFGSTFKIERMFKETFLKETIFYSYFKIDLSQIIAYIIKIQAIKICHDYDNNLA